jgi:HSP20 family protein
MSRSFYIEDINQENIRASHENGLLRIQLPKDKKAPTKKSIEIQ